MHDDRGVTHDTNIVAHDAWYPSRDRIQWFCCYRLPDHYPYPPPPAIRARELISPSSSKLPPHRSPSILTSDWSYHDVTLHHDACNFLLCEMTAMHRHTERRGAIVLTLRELKHGCCCRESRHFESWTTEVRSGRIHSFWQRRPEWSQLAKGSTSPAYLGVISGKLRPRIDRRRCC